MLAVEDVIRAPAVSIPHIHRLEKSMKGSV